MIAQGEGGQSAPSRRLRVLFICGAKADYPRNESLLAALRPHADVTEISSHFRSYLLRLPSVIGRLLLERGSFDIILVGFLAQPIVPFALLRHRKPLIVDMFISLSETLSEDRKTVGPRSFVGRLARWLDQLSCSRAAKVLADTPLDAEYLAGAFQIRPKDVVPLYMGANEEIFKPQPEASASDRFLVLYYSTYLPLHGVDVVVRAAKLLEEDRVRFRVIGRGMERPRIDRLAAEIGVRNCEFVDWVPYHELPREIAAADLCLAGHFSTGNAKSERVIPGKAFQFIAMAKPTVLGDSPAVSAVFEHGKDGFLVRQGDPEALANAIRHLRDRAELRRTLGERGRILFQTRFDRETLSRQLGAVLGEIASSTGPAR